MFFVRFKCPKCGELFRVFRFLVTSQSTKDCPKCGAQEVPVVEDDAVILAAEEKRESCGSFG